MTKRENLAVLFGSALVLSLMLVFSTGVSNGGKIIADLVIPNRMIYRGIFCLVCYSFITIYGSKPIIFWGLPLTVAVGLIFRVDWMLMLVYLISTLILIIMAELNFSEGNFMTTLAKSVFSVIVVMTIETFLMTIIVKNASFSSAIAPAIVIGFIFGFLTGVMVLALSMILKARKKVNGRHVAYEQPGDV